MAKSYVVSLGNKVFRLTQTGLDEAVRLRDGNKDEEIPAPSSRLGREEERIFQHALQSQAFDAWKRGKGADLIDYDARMFFQFSTGTPVTDRRRRVESTMSVLSKVSELKEGEEAKTLLDLAQELADRFSHLWKAS